MSCNFYFQASFYFLCAADFGGRRRLNTGRPEPCKLQRDNRVGATVVHNPLFYIVNFRVGFDC